jgi:serine/threonine protein kinase
MQDSAGTADLGLLAGDTLDKYRLVRELGAGGMGQVWLAQDPNLEREVAVKVLLPEYSSDPRFRERFRREAQTMMDLQNAPIVAVMNYFEAEEPRSGRLLAAMVMQYMPGGTLEDRIGGRQGLPLAEALQVASDALGALAEIHEMDIVHRDLKPSNFLFTQHGKIRISDFGIAIATDPNQRLTQARGIIGTATYMSPEQAMGEFELDHRSDVYSFGVVLFEILTGRVPFDCLDPNARDPGSEIRKMHLQSPPPRVQGLDSGLDPWLDRVIQKALAKSKDDRWQSCRHFQQAIAACAKRDEKQLAALLGVAAPAAKHHPPTVLMGGSGTELLTDLGPPPAAPDSRVVPAPPPPPPPQRSRTGLIVTAAAVLVPVLGYLLGQAGILPLPASLLWTDNLLEQARSSLENNSPCRARELFDAYSQRRPNDTAAQEEGQQAFEKCAPGDFHLAQALALESNDPCEAARHANDARRFHGDNADVQRIAALEVSACAGKPPLTPAPPTDTVEIPTGPQGPSGATARIPPPPTKDQPPTFSQAACDEALRAAQQLENNLEPCLALQRLNEAPEQCASINQFQTAQKRYGNACNATLGGN